MSEEKKSLQDNKEDHDDIHDIDEVNKESEDPSSAHQQGDKLTLVRVRFPGNAKSFPFTFGERRFSYGQKVIAESDRGMTVGYINSFPYTTVYHKNMHSIKKISKAATQEDIQGQKEYVDKEVHAKILCTKLIKEFNLDMNLTHVEYIQFGKKVVFYFNAPARVDFRDLVKKLVSELKVRVELRQISVRDRAAAIGATGACGLQTCCSSFLRQYGNVSIKMAKNQNLALIPSKINGVCGQLKCCIKYEDDVYTDKRKKLPKEGRFIQTKNGDKGKVTRLHVLAEEFEVLTDQGKIRRYTADQFDESIKLPKEWKFPTSFDHINSETANIIGEKKVEASTPSQTQASGDEDLIEVENLENDL